MGPRGRTAYAVLPPCLLVSCVLESTHPSFFLLPLTREEHWGVQVYEDWGAQRKWRDLQTGHWKDDKAPQNICYYGPATWAEVGSYRYYTLIYMLNHIIRVQAVVEIITKLQKVSIYWPNKILKCHLPEPLNLRLLTCLRRRILKKI